MRVFKLCRPSRSAFSKLKKRFFLPSPVIDMIRENYSKNFIPFKMHLGVKKLWQMSVSFRLECSISDTGSLFLLDGSNIRLWYQKLVQVQFSWWTNHTQKTVGSSPSRSPLRCILLIWSQAFRCNNHCNLHSPVSVIVSLAPKLCHSQKPRCKLVASKVSSRVTLIFRLKVPTYIT